MFLKLLKNDFRKNLWNNLVLFLFIGLSAAIAVTVTLVLSQLFTSISSMYETANPPHFLQMHKGELVQSDIDAFNRSYEGIEHWQTVPMINVSGEDLTVSDDAGMQFTLSDCRLDISLVKQNDTYDVLLDRSRNPLEVRSGEIGVPVILLDDYDISLGDKITLTSGGSVRTFTVTSYVCDGQMNSTLCSSTRFLISDGDFDALFGNAGETEYLIEAFFTDTSQAAEYQTAYEQSERDLPKNGQAITYTMIFLLSALTDLLMAMVFLLTCVLLIAIALICLRYAVLAELEDDMQEIGTMKAMGIPGRGICGLYLGKIRILTVLGCVFGYALALFLASALTGHISRTFGEQPLGIESYALAVLVSAAVYGIILLFSRKVLSRIKKATVTDLLVTETGFGIMTKVNDGLRNAQRLPVNLLMGLHAVRKGYGIIFGLLLIVSFLISLPYRTVQTMQSEEFVTYMGSPVCDMLLEVEQGEDLEERNRTAENLLRSQQAQGHIDSFSALRRVRLQAVRNDGKITGIHVDTGDSAGSGLRYLSGRSPKSEAEIALSCLMAEEVEKTQDDTIILRIDGEAREFSICGIYQDVTSGGRTAKTICTFPEQPAEKYTYQVTLTPHPNSEPAIKNWRDELGSGFSVENMEEFLQQTLGGVSSQIKQASYLVFFVGVVLTILITVLFLKLRIAREAPALAAKKAMGIPFSAIRLQELYPVLLAGGMGSAGGILLTEFFGDNLISSLFGILGLGLKEIVFSDAALWQQAAILFALLATLTGVTCCVCQQIKKLDSVSQLNK